MAGLVIRRQRPLSRAVFMTLEDEFGHIPLMVMPKVYERYRMVLREPLVKVWGGGLPAGGHPEHRGPPRRDHPGSSQHTQGP